MRTLSIPIVGMTCDHCVAAVRKALASVPGASVNSVTIGMATVTYDPSRTNPSAIAEAIRDAGYETATAEMSVEQ